MGGMSEPPVEEDAPGRAAAGGRWRRRALGLVVAAALGAGALAFASHRVAAARTVHVFNATPAAAVVRFPGDGGPVVEVAPGGEGRVVVPEGDYAVVVEARGARREVAVDVRTDPLDRLSREPLFVLDVGGASAFLWEEAAYGPAGATAAPRPPRLRCGVPFLRFEHVDYPFAAFPDAVESGSPSGGTRTRVERLRGSPAAVLAAHGDAAPAADEVLGWLETRLAFAPDDAATAAEYVRRARAAGAADRAEAFLAGGLERRPVAIPWHRAYQDLVRAGGEEAALRARYDALLAEAPGDSALLYLRGRLDPDARAALALYERAVAADEANAHARFARGLVRASRGELAAAQADLERAANLAPDRPAFAALAFDVRVLRRDDLAGAAAALAGTVGLDPGRQRRLLTALAGAGRLEEARRVHRRYAERVRAVFPGDARGFAAVSAATLHDLAGEPAAALEAAEGMPASRRRARLRFAALLALGRLEAAEALLDGDLAGEADLALLLGLAWLTRREAPEGPEALGRLRERAAGWLDVGGGRDRRLAALLRAGAGLAVDDARAVALPPPAMAAALLVLAEAASPDVAPDLLAWADRLDDGLLFPGRLLRAARAALSR